MGIKSTTTLRRSDAERLYEELKAKLFARKKPKMTNTQLGDALDYLKDTEAEREDRPCFDNYLVVDDEEA